MFVSHGFENYFVYKIPTMTDYKLETLTVIINTYKKLKNNSFDLRVSPTNIR